MSNDNGLPSLLDTVKRFDRLVSPPVNRFVRTNLFTDSIAALTRFEARARRQLESRTSTALHMLNMPTATDMKKVRGQLASLEVRLRDVSDQLDDRQASKRSTKE